MERTYSDTGQSGALQSACLHFSGPTSPQKNPFVVISGPSSNMSTVFLQRKTFKLFAFTGILKHFNGILQLTYCTVSYKLGKQALQQIEKCRPTAADDRVTNNIRKTQTVVYFLHAARPT